MACSKGLASLVLMLVSNGRRSTLRGMYATSFYSSDCENLELGLTVEWNKCPAAESLFLGARFYGSLGVTVHAKDPTTVVLCVSICPNNAKGKASENFVALKIISLTTIITSIQDREGWKAVTTSKPMETGKRAKTQSRSKMRNNWRTWWKSAISFNQNSHCNF